MNGILTGIYIQGEGFHRIGCEEDFKQLLEEKLGQDAADMFEQLLPQGCPNCGECDYVYDLHYDYESAIREALEMLDVVEAKKNSVVHLEDAKIILRGALT